LSCPAIQAHQAERAANLFVAELTISFLTLFVVGVAAGFAYSAARAGHDANRPWLEIQLSQFTPFHVGASGADFTGELKIWNRGKSPATYVKPLLQLFVFNVEMDRSERAAIAQRTIENLLRTKDGKRHKTGRTIFQKNEPTDIMLSGEVSEVEIAHARGTSLGQAIYQIAVGVRYKFGWLRSGYTVNSYELRLRIGDISYIPNVQTSVGVEHIGLIDCEIGYAR